MPDEDRADREWKSWEQVGKKLNFAREQELWQWMASDLFRPYWLELWNDFYVPERKRKGPMRQVHVPETERIIQRIQEGQRHGQNRYGRITRHRPLDKTSWDALDHFAFFLYTTTKENQEDAEGIFKDLPRDDIHHWALMTMPMRRIARDHLPSRISRDNVGGKIADGRLPEVTMKHDSMPPPKPSPAPPNVLLGDGKISVRWYNAPEQALLYHYAITRVRFMSFAEFQEQINLGFHLRETGHILKQLFWEGPAWESYPTEMDIDSDQEWAIVREAARPTTTQALRVYVKTAAVNIYTNTFSNRLLLAGPEDEEAIRRDVGRTLLLPAPPEKSPGSELQPPSY